MSDYVLLLDSERRARYRDSVYDFFNLSRFGVLLSVLLRREEYSDRSEDNGMKRYVPDGSKG